MDFQHILYRCKAINKYQCERVLCSHGHIVFLCTIDKAWELLLQCSSKSYGVERAHRTFAISLTQIRDAFYVIEIYPSKKKVYWCTSLLKNAFQRHEKNSIKRRLRNAFEKEEEEQRKSQFQKDIRKHPKRCGFTAIPR